MHGLLFKIQYGHYDSPPASHVNHEPQQLISQETFGGRNSQQRELSFSCVRNVLKNELKCHAWKPRYYQALCAEDILRHSYGVWRDDVGLV